DKAAVLDRETFRNGRTVVGREYLAVDKNEVSGLGQGCGCGRQSEGGEHACSAREAARTIEPYSHTEYPSPPNTYSIVTHFSQPRHEAPPRENHLHRLQRPARCRFCARLPARRSADHRQHHA